MFDLAVHFVNGGGKGGPIERILGEIGNPSDFDLIPLSELVHWLDLQNDIDISIPTNIENYAQRLISKFPEETNGIQRFFSKYEKIVRWMLELNEKNSKSSRLLHVIGNIGTATAFLKVLNQSVEEILSPYIKSKRVKNTMCYLVSSLASYPEEFSALIYLLMQFTLAFSGAHYPKGGIGKFSGKLGHYFELYGGKLFLNCEATQLNASEDTAENLFVHSVDKTSADFSIEAKRFVIAGDLHNFASHIMPFNHRTEKYRNKILRKTPSNGSFVLFIGLNLNLKTLGIEDHELWIYGRNAYTDANLNSVVNQLDVTKLPLEIITVYSNTDETCAPAGKSVFTITFPSNCYAWKQLTRTQKQEEDAYKQLKAKFTEQLIEILSKALRIPELKKHIEVAELVTPLDYATKTGNLGGSHLGWKTTAKSIRKDRITNSTPFKNVYATGQWTFPGGGVTSVMLNGLNVAKQIQKELNSKLS